LAAKYEEIYPPEVADIVYCSDKAFSKDDLLKSERKIVLALEFNITSISPYRCLERFYKLA
jgi:hypothetical protein